MSDLNLKRMVGSTGIEPVTPTVSSFCSQGHLYSKWVAESANRGTQNRIGASKGLVKWG